MRIAEISRKTKETDIELKLDLDGSGKVKIDTGIGFFNHMLTAFAVHSGIDLHMVGVNLTRQCPVDSAFIDRLRGIGNHTGEFCAQLCDFFSKGGDAHLHDACAVAWLIDPSLIESAYLHVDIELNGLLTRGMTVTDLRFLQTTKPDADIDLTSTARWDDPEEGSPFRGKAPNTHVAFRLDYEGFCKLLTKTIANYP